MKEKFVDEDFDEINTSSNNINNTNNFDLNKKITLSINHSPFNLKSTSDDDNLLLNNEINEINLSNSNNSNYIQSSIAPSIYPLEINKINTNKINEVYQLNDKEELNTNFSPRESRVSIIETFNEKLNTKTKFNIREQSFIPVSILNDKSLSNDCFNGVQNAPSFLLSDFMKVNTELILDKILNVRKKFFRKLNTTEIMSWQKKEISNSLLKMNHETDISISILMFRKLLAYMCDRKSSKKSTHHATRFINLVKYGNPILRDEAYLQVYKQLNRNKKEDSFMRGLKFLAILSSSFLPNNKNIYNIILNYLFFEFQKATNKQIKNHINYIFTRLVKAKQRERKMTPSVEEMEYIESLKSIQIPIYYFNGKHSIVKIESYTTFKEVKNIIMNKLSFRYQRTIFYSIYEICYKPYGTEERFLDDNEIICDVLSIWKSDIRKSKNNKEDILFRFYLKLLIYYPYDETLIDNIAIEYYQIVYDVISGKFNLIESEILILGALQLVNEFGNNIEKAYCNIKENYQNYIPWKYMFIMSNDQWIEKIMEFYSYFMDYEQNICQKEYIKLLENHNTFNTQLFYCKFDEKKSSEINVNIPEECILGFKQDGIQIFDIDKNKIIFYEYIHIKTWGVSPNFFVIFIEKENSKINQKLYFHTGETNVIQTIMTIYSYFIAGKSLREITNNIEERDSSFDNNRTNKRIPSKYFREKEDKLDEHYKNFKKFFVFPNSSMEDDK